MFMISEVEGFYYGKYMFMACEIGVCDIKADGYDMWIKSFE